VFRNTRGRITVAVTARVALLTAAAGLLAAGDQAARATEQPVVAIVGDSYAAGWTSTTGRARPWHEYTATDLGWTVGNVVADPGAGFVQPGDHGTLLQALIAHPIPPSTDYVLIQAGLNDAQQTPGSVPPAVAAVLAEVRRQAPQAAPIVVGALMPFPDHLAGPHQIDVARRIGDHEAIGPDTRYMIAFMCTFDVGPDSVHPTAAGHQQIGNWVAWHLANGLDNGHPLQFNGTSYTA
jgi:lysophospholipase L1-like esterase